MGTVKVVLNREGVRELLLSKELEDILASHAAAIQGRAGDGYETDTYHGTNRVNAMVWAESGAAIRDNSQNNTLLKSVRGG